MTPIVMSNPQNWERKDPAAWLEGLRARWTRELPPQDAACEESLRAWADAGRPCDAYVAGQLSGDLWRELSNASMGFKRL